MARTPKNIDQKTRLLILCEGETECIYFSELRTAPDVRRRFAAVDVKKPKQYDARGMLTHAIRELAKPDSDPMNYDKVWCVFDRDDQLHLREAFETASRNNVKIAFSSMCFEYWLMLHRTYSSRLYQTCDEIVRDLESYKKADVSSIRKLIASVDHACTNAKKRREEFAFDTTQVWERFSYTDVDLLVDMMRGLEA